MSPIELSWTAKKDIQPQAEFSSINPSVHLPIMAFEGFILGLVEDFL